MSGSLQAAKSPDCDERHGIGADDRDRLDGLVGTLPGSVVYRLVMDSSGAATLAYVSPAIEEAFGLSREAVMADVSSWYALIHPDDEERVLATQGAAFARREPFRATSRYLLADKTEKLFEIQSSPAPQDDGCIVWNGVATDVTEAEQVRTDRQRLLNLIEATPDFVFVMTIDGRVEYANPAAVRLGRRHGKDVRALTLFDMHPPETIAMFEREAFPTLMRTGLWNGEASVRLSGGETMPVETVIVAHAGPDGQVTHFASTTKDLTTQHAAAARIAEANDRVETALREVNHRIKNFFALVPALVKLSARTAESAEGLSEAVQARIGALSRSHTLTLNAFSEGDGIALRGLIEAVLEPYEESADAFDQSGPDVRLSGRTGNAVALTLHELATNAAKHGVLSANGGSVCIAWETPEADGRTGLKVTWTEDGGPPVTGPPERAGFGTSLLDRLIAAQGGRIERDWRREGLEVTITLPQL